MVHSLKVMNLNIHAKLEVEIIDSSLIARD
jgi:hypothetical protein